MVALLNRERPIEVSYPPDCAPVGARLVLRRAEPRCTPSWGSAGYDLWCFLWWWLR